MSENVDEVLVEAFTVAEAYVDLLDLYAAKTGISREGFALYVISTLAARLVAFYETDPDRIEDALDFGIDNADTVKPVVVN